MTYAALGESAKAREAAARYALLERDDAARLERRLDQWRAWHAQLRSASEAAPVVLAAPLRRARWPRLRHLQAALQPRR